MTEPKSANPDGIHQVGGRVHIHRSGQREPGRSSSVYRHTGGIEYVVRIDAPTGRYGAVVKVWTTSGQSSFLSRATVSGEH